MRGELARLDATTMEIHSLLRLAPGMQAASVVVGTDTFAWVEMSATDLRGYDWRLHLTSAIDGADRVIASDPGLRIEAGFTDHSPTLWFDGTTLLYTILVKGSGASPAWELRRLRAEQTDRLAQLASASAQRFIRFDAVGDTVAWLEGDRSAGPIEQATVASFSGSGPARRRALNSRAYVLRLAPAGVYVGTEQGVVLLASDLTGSIAGLPGDPGVVEQLALLGRYVLYGNTNLQTTTAVDPTSRAVARLGQNVTYGPIQGDGFALWFERDPAGGPGKYAIARAPLR